MAEVFDIKCEGCDWRSSCNKGPLSVRTVLATLPMVDVKYSQYPWGERRSLVTYQPNEYPYAIGKILKNEPTIKSTRLTCYTGESTNKGKRVHTYKCIPDVG